MIKPTHKNFHFSAIADMSADQLVNMLSLARELAEDKANFGPKLSAKVIATMFREPSTRTRASFTMAAYKLGANLIDIPPESSSLEKGESLFDTFLSLQAMNINLFVIRHQEENLIKQLSGLLHVPVVNAGDGTNEHPSQTLLDLLTISLERGDTKDLKIALVGDVQHSRVANSFISAMSKLGCGELCLVGPRELLPGNIPATSAGGNIRIERDMDKGIKDADIIMMLRIQRERIELVKQQEGILGNHEDYFNLYGLSKRRLALAKNDVLVMHPGPLNRGVEISPEVADSPNSVIIKQVEYGVYARMAIFLSLLDEEWIRRVWGD